MLSRLFNGSAKPADIYRVPDAARVYAVGDIHGQLQLLRELRHMIADDAKAGGRERNVVVYLGDFIDRGPDSRGVIELFLDETLDGFEEIHLKGNHEDYMVQFLQDPTVGESWYLNGGDTTLMSYGVDRTAAAPGQGRFAAMSDDLRRKLPVQHLAFLRSLDLYHVEGDYLFVHAGIRPGRPIESQKGYDLMWIRDEFLSSKADHGCCVVHGHSIRPEPDMRPNRIGIDTGAFYTGRLTALVLDGAERRFLHT
jgi:serine/threonine protein phosphatase 1